VFAVDLVFHNAYGPDKPWFYDPELSGGGCVMDLGVHLVDLALWSLDFPGVTNVTSTLMAKGAPLPLGANAVEDYAVATLTLDTGAVVRLACSWRLHAGEPAVIGAAFQGVEGGAALRNIGGSFYDFAADQAGRHDPPQSGYPAGRLGRSGGRRLGKPTGGGRPVRSSRRAAGRCGPGA
jgi:predicted dehydrogenase